MTQETTLVSQIQNLLLNDGYLVIRVNSGAATTRNKTGAERFVRFVSWSSPEIYKSIAGVSDILAFSPIFRLAIEAKVGSNKPTEKQNIFLQQWRNSGGIDLVVRDLSQLQPYLQRTCIQ